MGWQGKFFWRRAIALLLFFVFFSSLTAWVISPYQLSSIATFSDQRLYEPPKRIAAFIERAREATLALSCESKGGEYPYGGSAWHIEIAGERYLITNAHVVQGCLDDGFIYVYDEFDNPHRVQLLGYRHHDTFARDWDIAVLSGRNFGKALPLELEPPKAGHWVLAAGWPSVDREHYQQVAMGNVLGLGARKTVVFSAVTNPGMSGGPVLNSAGKVVGIHYATTRDVSRRALAQPISNLCDVALVCSGDRGPLVPLQFPENPVKTYIEDED